MPLLIIGPQAPHQSTLEFLDKNSHLVWAEGMVEQGYYFLVLNVILLFMWLKINLALFHPHHSVVYMCNRFTHKCIQPIAVNLLLFHFPKAIIEEKRNG